MIINKINLLEEIKRIHAVRSDIYVGKLKEIKKMMFDSDELFVASIIRISYVEGKVVWSEMQYKYIFEKVTYFDKIYYREIFSGANLETFNFKFNNLSDNCCIYVFNPSPFNNINQYFKAIDNEKNDCIVKVRTI